MWGGGNYSEPQRVDRERISIQTTTCGEGGITLNHSKWREGEISIQNHNMWGGGNYSEPQRVDQKEARPRTTTWGLGHEEARGRGGGIQGGLRQNFNPNHKVGGQNSSPHPHMLRFGH
jgi:hypothetical protein